jgi:hypothetical protein
MFSILTISKMTFPVSLNPQVKKGEGKRNQKMGRKTNFKPDYFKPDYFKPDYFKSDYSNRTNR